MRPALVSFIGWHNAGKTTLASQVVRQLKERGYRVAVVKSSKDQGLYHETVGCDTSTYRQAGAAAVLLVTPEQLIFQHEERDLSQIARRFLHDFDLVLGEGFKDNPQVPKIEVFRGQGPLLYPSRPEVLALVTDEDLSPAIPLFALDAIQALADFIEERFLLARAGEDLSSKDIL